LWRLLNRRVQDFEAMTRVAPTAMLDPSLLAGIDDLELLVRTVVDGFLHGAHRSSRTGLSLDFAEHREYQPGDDLRRIDWRVYARTDRFYLKTYEAETNADLRVAIDISASMDFGTGSLTKFGWGRALLSSLAWLAQKQGDRVGFIPLGADTSGIVPSSTRHLPLVLQELSRTKPAGSIDLGPVLERTATLQGRAGMLAIVTDCYDEPVTIQHGVMALRARGHDVMLFHIIDQAERDFPYDGPDTFADLESSQRLALKPDEVRESYVKAFDDHCRELESRIGATGADYLRVYCDEPLDRALRGWLEFRRRPELAR
jgi:uncharacterized protein (DUF58 family)